MLNIQGVPQVTMNGLEIVDGAKIVRPSLNEVASINGIPQTAYHGIESINGALKSSLGTWPSFPGWTETDPNSGITITNVSNFDSSMQFGDTFQNGSFANVVVTLPAAWDNSYGDWNIRYEFAGYDHTASGFMMFGVASGTKPYTGGAGSLAGDGEDFALWGYRGAGSGWIATQEFINGGIGWSQTGWSGETPAKDSPDVYYNEMARESGVIYIRTYSDSSFSSQLGVDAISNAVGAGFSVDRILMTMFTSSTSTNQDGWLKMISVTPNPWS